MARWDLVDEIDSAVAQHRAFDRLNVDVCHRQSTLCTSVDGCKFQLRLHSALRTSDVDAPSVKRNRPEVGTWE